MSEEFTRLRDIHALVEPVAVFVQSGLQFAKALKAIGTPSARTIVVTEPKADQRGWSSLLDTPMTPERLAAVEAAHAAIARSNVARIYFTLGSTGVPKGVPLTYANLSTMRVSE